DADKMTAKLARHGACRAGAEERVEHDIAWLGGGIQNAEQQRFGLLRGVKLAILRILEALGAGADREEPVRPHLRIVIRELHGFIVEGHAALLASCSPDQRFM